MPSYHAEPNLDLFTRAVELVYGPLPLTDDPSWTPPVAPGGHEGRYLWTDTFGVVKFLILYLLTREQRYLTCARNLIDSMHSMLGRTRGSIRRLRNTTGEEPLAEGLRIGKADDSCPDGDGQ
jgi:hypothetical protein